MDGYGVALGRAEPLGVLDGDGVAVGVTEGEGEGEGEGDGDAGRRFLAFL